VAFAALHLWRHPALAALGVLPVSLLLGWVYERSGERLLPPVLLHLYFNAVLVASSYAVG
jgi:membrane protease YdiL (CAAX protease family)